MQRIFMTTPPNKQSANNQAPKSKIYTKTGDKGKTRLVGGDCVDKFNPRVEAYGTTDELNSYLGVVRCLLPESPSLLSLDPVLESIQNELFNLGSQLACEDVKVAESLPPVSADSVSRLEKKIDEMDNELPKLNQFILPAGHPVAAHFHYARTLCRRAERRAVELHHHDPRFDKEMVYLNRLSDFLFVAARWCNLKTRQADVIWKKGP
jgi:cob(I)alamin adenosyltransferase